MLVRMSMRYNRIRVAILSRLAPDVVSGMQMHQFWRPSAWADYLHAYTPTNRLLLSKHRVSHLLFSPHRFIIFELPGIAIIVSYGLGSWTSRLFFAVFLYMWRAVYLSRLRSAMKRNLTPDNKELSTNMPTLFTHLRQLQAAGHVIKSSIAHGKGSSNSSLQADAASMSSNVALMQATRHLSIITANLEARLESAYNKCCSHHTQLGHHTSMDAGAELASNLLSPDALQRIQNSMTMGVQGMWPLSELFDGY